MSFRCFLWSASLLWASQAQAQQLALSKVDRATVRVFSIQGLDVAQVKGKSRRIYTLAVPLAGHGSGTLLSHDGLVLSAFHVVRNTRYLVVKVPEHERAYSARPVYVDKDNDLILLSVAGEFAAFLTMPDEMPVLQARQTVDALGYPLDASRTLPQSSRGIIAGLLPNNEIQLSMSVNPGNSGGPLVDERENLLGVVVARGDPNQGIQGIGIAIPLQRIREPYARVVAAGGRYAEVRAQAAGASERERDLAELFADFVDSGRSMFDEMIERAKTGKPGETLQRVDRLVGRDDARHGLAHALAAAYYWNEAVVRIELGKRDAAELLRKARALCEKAKRLDEKLYAASHFLEHCVRSGSPRARPVKRLPTRRAKRR